jgi:hypothetical protein
MRPVISGGWVPSADFTFLVNDISTWSVAGWTLFRPGHGVCDKYALAPASTEAQARGKGRRQEVATRTHAKSPNRFHLL